MPSADDRRPLGQHGIPNPGAVFLSVVLVLSGAQLYHLLAHAATAIVQGLSDDAVAMFAIWLTLALGGTAFGCAGAYRAVRTGALKDPFLLVFFLLFCVTIGSANWHPSPWVLAITFQLDWGAIRIGINAIGIVFLTIYSALPDPESARPKSHGTAVSDSIDSELV